MNRPFLAKHYRWIGVTSLLWSLIGAIAPAVVQAQVPLTRADVESIRNRVDILLDGQATRPARLSDWLSVGDALRTAAASGAELRFNDGSLARVGERATFRFTPNTRTFRLSNGTVLLLIPPGQGPSQIRTPSAVTGVQGTALVIRHIPFSDDETGATWDSTPSLEAVVECVTEVPPAADVAVSSADVTAECAEESGEPGAAIAEHPGRTVVMVLTDNPQGPVAVTTTGGTTATLTAGDMAVVEGEAIQVMEFDLALFYETSPLVEGLHLDNPNFQGDGSPTDPVRQETLNGLATQQEFVGGYFLNSSVVNSDDPLSATTDWVIAPATVAENLATDSLAGLSVSDRTPSRTVRSNNLMSARLGTGVFSSSWRGALNSTPAGMLNPPATGTQSTSGMSTSSGMGTFSGGSAASNPPTASGGSTMGSGNGGGTQSPTTSTPPTSTPPTAGSPGNAPGGSPPPTPEPEPTIPDPPGESTPPTPEPEPTIPNPPGEPAPPTPEPTIPNPPGEPAPPPTPEPQPTLPNPPGEPAPVPEPQPPAPVSPPGPSANPPAPEVTPAPAPVPEIPIPPPGPVNQPPVSTPVQTPTPTVPLSPAGPPASIGVEAPVDAFSNTSENTVPPGVLQVNPNQVEPEVQPETLMPESEMNEPPIN